MVNDEYVDTTSTATWGPGSPNLWGTLVFFGGVFSMFYCCYKKNKNSKVSDGSMGKALLPTDADDSAPKPKSGMMASLEPVLKILMYPDYALLAYFFFWFLGNYYYNVTNKKALKESGGSDGYPMTVSALQLAPGCLYALFMWVAPQGRNFPTVTMSDLVAIMPVAFCSMAAHSASVFALSAGSVSFGQIVKAAEPAFAAVLSQFLYGRPVSKAKWMCLPIIIGGVILASVKELDFAFSALFSACVANLFAAFKANENKKLMTTPGLKERIGGVGNQFAISSIMAFIMSVPLFIAKEGHKWDSFVETYNNVPEVRNNIIYSGIFFYGYNELATMTIKKTNAVTASVANTAKRVFVLVGVAIVFGEDLNPLKMVGCAIGIGGVFVYSIIDKIVKPAESK